MALKKSKKHFLTKRVKKRGTKRNIRKHKTKYGGGHLPLKSESYIKKPGKMWEHDNRGITGINDRQIMLNEMQTIQQKEQETMENLQHAENRKGEIENMIIAMNQRGIKKEEKETMEKIIRGYKLVEKRCDDLIYEVHHLRNEYENLRDEFRRRYA